jgi:hypothetical protein
MPKDHRTLGRFAALLLVAGALLTPACSSEDEATPTTADTDSGGDSGDSGGEDAATAIDCDEVLAVAEVEALFGEPAVLEEVDPISNSEELGQTTCTWTTVEDEDDAEDLASQLLVLQYYDGSTMSGANFYDPAVQYPDAEPLDIGDDGFVNVGTGSVDVGFLDGETSGFLSWTAIDMSGDAPDPAAKEDAVVGLAQSFHDQVS